MYIFRLFRYIVGTYVILVLRYQIEFRFPLFGICMQVLQLVHWSRSGLMMTELEEVNFQCTVQCIKIGVKKHFTKKCNNHSCRDALPQK
jgi:hypothetical protein